MSTRALLGCLDRSPFPRAMNRLCGVPLAKVPATRIGETRTHMAVHIKPILRNCFYKGGSGGQRANFILAISMCALMIACGKEPPSVERAAAPVLSPSSPETAQPEKQASPAPPERIMVTIPGRGPESIRSALWDCNSTAERLDINLEALADVLERAQCVNKLLVQAPNDPDWRVAYFIRGRMLLTAAALVRALENPGPAAQPLTAQQAQAQLVGRDRLQLLKKQTHQLASSAAQEVTEAIADSVMKTLQTRGLALGDPIPEINALNVSRRQVGIFTWDLEKTSDDKKFVVTRALFDVMASFVLEGYGLVSTRAEFVTSIEGSTSESALFDETCKIRVRIVDSTWMYPCLSYVSGLNGDAASDAGVLALEKALREKASSSSR